jgi:hypothetical protein
MGKGTESLFSKIIVENFPRLGRDINIQIHEVLESPSRELTQRHPFQGTL